MERHRTVSMHNLSMFVAEKVKEYLESKPPFFHEVGG